MLPVKRVIASATRSSVVASTSSRRRRALRDWMFRSSTEVRPGGRGGGTVGLGPAWGPALASPFGRGLRILYSSDRLLSSAASVDTQEPGRLTGGSTLAGNDVERQLRRGAPRR